MEGESPNADVRMRGFHERTTVEAAIQWIDDNSPVCDCEPVELEAAGGRVLAEKIVSGVDVPGFDRSMMDGFALHAEDTLGSTAYNPLQLEVIGESLPGNPFRPPDDSTVQQGQAIRIMTGAPMPAGADAVLPVEKTELRGTQHVVALDAVSPGKNVGRRGEDIQAGMDLLPAGRRLRPQDIGLISSIGCGQVEVIRRPKVRIVVTGDELLPPGSMPHGCQIADSNSPMLANLIHRDGGIAINPGIVPDQPDEVLKALRSEVDIVLVSGGSSVGQEDHAPVLLHEHGDLAVHGIAMRPSSPAGMGKLQRRLVFLLPGNPVSCLCAYDFFAGRAIRALAGMSRDWPYRKMSGQLSRKVVSTIGRVDYARVRLTDAGIEPIAISGASILSSTTASDGFLIIDGDREGFAAGTSVEVFLYDY